MPEQKTPLHEYEFVCGAAKTDITVFSLCILGGNNKYLHEDVKMSGQRNSFQKKKPISLICIDFTSVVQLYHPMRWYKFTGNEYRNQAYPGA